METNDHVARQEIWTDAWEREDKHETTYLDRKPFKEYCRLILGVIQAADHALSIGDIHRALGDRKNERWTADALEMINGIEEVSVKPVRYRPRNRPDIPVVAPYRDGIASLFAKA